MTRTRIKIIVFAALTVLIAAGIGITCGIVFGGKETSKTTREWLSEFKHSFESAVLTTDSAGNTLPVNVTREIEIKENDVVVAVYRQKLQITVNEGNVVSYLSTDENYPTQESADSVHDEYYLVGETMYTRRVNADEMQTSTFTSTIDILLTVASENMGEVKYDFSESNFVLLTDSAEIITHDGETHKLAALVEAERYVNFFGQDADIADITDVRIEMVMTGTQFNSLIIAYTQSGLSTKITITGHAVGEITAPEWIQ